MRKKEEMNLSNLDLIQESSTTENLTVDELIQESSTPESLSVDELIQKEPTSTKEKEVVIILGVAKETSINFYNSNGIDSCKVCGEVPQRDIDTMLFYCPASGSSCEYSDLKNNAHNSI